MKRTYRYLIATALIAAMLFAGCSSSGTRSERDSEAQAATAEVAEHNAAIDGFYTEQIAPMENADFALGAEDYEYESIQRSDNSSVGTVSSSDQVLTERMLIRTVSMSCETLNFTEVTTSIEQQVAALGGYIESKSFNGTGNTGSLRTASYTIRVSSEALDQLIASIGNTALVISNNESSEDVTLSYADTQARIESLRVEQETLNNLLAQADSLDIILQLQNELTNVRYQIESYESQLRVLENLSSFSTLNLYISEVIEETEVEEAHVKTYSEKLSEAFHDGLDRAKESLEDIGLYLAENVIGLSVTIVIMAIAITVIVITVKKIKRKAKKGSSVTAAPKAPVQNDEKKD